MDEMFGVYTNRVNQKTFMNNLGEHGWKYFDLYSLNGIFVEKFNELEDDDKQGVVLEMFGAGLGSRLSANK